MSFELLPFQEDATDKLRDAAVEWIETIRKTGLPPVNMDHEQVPLLAQLQAITGAGKTPILASVVGGVGPAIVLWTTKSRVVVQQTAQKLRGVYAPLLPGDTIVLEEMPAPDQWHDLLEQEAGLTIWIKTVASWNEPDDERKGDDEARLSMHRKAPDITGDDRTFWQHLADSPQRKRPLWIVYDEGHGQTTVQLDQLVDLQPMGIIAASATPIVSARWAALAESLKASKTWGPIYEKAQVSVPTGEVAKAGLLKSEIKVHDLNIDDVGRLAVVYQRFEELDAVAADGSAGVTPRAIYIVEQSNLKKGEAGDPPPTVIWRYLHERCGIPVEQIAVATDTKDLPKEAEQVSDFAALKPQHRHIIFNKKLEEGWDNPEAYIAYFDGETKSARRIKQLIGRVVRQPDGKARPQPELNTAYLYVAAPDKQFKDIVEGLEKQLVEQYGTDDFGQATVRVTVAGKERPAIGLRAGLPDLRLPAWRLEATGRIDDLLAGLAKEGERTFPDDQLDAPGEVRSLSFSLTEEERRIVEVATQAGINIRSANGAYLRDRVASASRAARNALKDSALAGPMYQQRAAYGSRAQEKLAAEARAFVDEFVNRVAYVEDWSGKRDWRPKLWQPRDGAGLTFARSVHTEYTDSRAVFNADELDFARALDAVADGWWARNFTTPAQNGYGLELPVKLGTSNSFYPDFLWWIDDKAFAIDTTGPHLLGDKVSGKLLTLTNPLMALVARGRISNDLLRKEDNAGWTLVRAATGGVAPRPEHYANLADLLSALRGRTSDGS